MAVSDYIKRLMQAREVVIRRSMVDLQKRMVISYANEMKEVVNQLNAGQISPEAAESMFRRIQDAVRRWQGGMSDQVKRSIADTIDEVRKVHQHSLDRLATDMDIELSYSFEGFNVDAYEGMFVRRDLGITNTYKTLENWNTHGQPALNDIEEAIEQSIKGNISWQESTRKIADTLSFGKKDIRGLLWAVQRDDFNISDLTDVEVGQLKNLFYNARRIAQTEVDVAYHEGERVAAVRNPIIKGLQWKTSGRHGTIRSSPDVCDVFEQHDFYGLGEGVFYAETLPAKPHPFDGCTRMFVLRDRREWTEAKEQPIQPAEIDAATVGTILNRNRNANSRGITPRFIAYTTAQANRYVRLAYQTWKQASEAA